MQKHKIAIAGAGNIAQNAHLPAYQKRDDVEVVAVCDLNLERAKDCAAKFNIPFAFSGVQEMLDNAPCDAVDICVWNRAHREIAVAAADRGRHILCEKPMALNALHALEMKKAVDKSGVTFMMAMPRRFMPEVDHLHRLAQSGEMGPVYHAKTNMVRRRGTPLGWFTDTAKSGGGPVIDIGVHAIDCAWYLMGRPQPASVRATTSYAIGNYQTKGVSRWIALDSDVTAFDTEDSAAGFFTFQNGASLAFDVSWAINNRDRDEMMIYGEKAGASLDFNGKQAHEHAPSTGFEWLRQICARFVHPVEEEKLVIYGEKDHYLSDDRPKFTHADPFEREIDAFLRCLKDGTKPDASLQDGLTMIRMLMGIYQSAREGREVSL